MARIAAELGVGIEAVHAMLDSHPIHSDRSTYVRRTLVIELMRLDELEESFRQRALGGDVASGTLVVKIAERRATLLGLNPPTGSSVTLIAHEPAAHQQTSTERIRAAIDRIVGISERERELADRSDDGPLTAAEQAELDGLRAARKRLPPPDTDGTAH